MSTSEEIIDHKKSFNILIVEDNPVFLDQLSSASTTLSDQAEIITASTGKEYQGLIKKLRKNFTIALIDLGLPDINGIEIIRDLTQRSPETIILVISVISNQETVISAIRAGARGYILKGESQASIAEAIKDVMAGNYPISPAIARYLFRLAGQDPKEAETSIDLTSREEETLRLIAAGSSYSEAAKTMGVSLSTVQTYIRSLYRKLGAHSQIQAVNKARSAGFLD